MFCEVQSFQLMMILNWNISIGTFYIWGHAVAQLVEALRYKPEGRGFDFRWCQWNFSLT